MVQQINKVLPVLACLWAVSGIQSVQATDINLSGTVVASACTVDTNTVDQTVNFEQARAVDYPNIGDTSEWQDFELTLSACPASTTKVTALFSGEVDNDDATKFANTQGDASGMALQIMTRDHLTEISPGAVYQVSIDSSHNVVFPLSARMYTPTGQVTAGEFRTTVQLTFTYQ
ncbi:TPA: fimbrial protein [Citrobacter braakii]|uniref:fimbrial protein n=1 Tax=Citrobacter TaxID=544 RepID=UPI0006433D7F|nr:MULTISPECIES: fimbrial protein [Citrobacter]KLQ08516.1 fimbrial protein [Citrobacter braakii]MDM3454708.1 fimbrial protein [Citrobacter sp. Cb028]MDV0580795.1 fimbrial protein [Citrobacter braakii]MEB0652498.1 fimbrial protein [Citrobacter braakii]QLV69106.1 fimbrial protein [Citrobacter sp. RHBSTW-00570]